jgi:hypothetical protein
MPVRHNRILLQACTNVTPVLLRDFRVMRAKINFLLSNLSHSLEQSAGLTDMIANDHGDDCDACVLLKNIEFRYKHDLDLYRAHLKNVELLFSGITQTDSINTACAADFLSLALTTRALLDNVFRSCILFMEGDIRIYNKYLADSLSSLRKLRWSTLSHGVPYEELDTVLTTFNSLSGKEKNESMLFADPAPTFRRKSEYLRAKCRDDSFSPFLDDAENLYSALSDMVHAGTATLAASAPKGPQIVVGGPELRFIASAHHLAELIGITLVSAHKWIIYLYLPVLTDALSCVEGTDGVRERLRGLQAALLSRIDGFEF